MLSLLLVATGLVGCGGTSPTPTSTPPSPALTATRPAATATTPPTAAPTATPARDESQPLGFPLDENARLGRVVGTRGSRTIAWGDGPTVRDYSLRDQLSADPETANDSGWDCRVHQDYEGAPAVDWYVPAGTAVRATMSGTATLYIVTVTNAFAYYSVPGEPYLGNPDRARAPIVPFAGPGGGKGVFVEVQNAGFVTDYGHMEPIATVANLPVSAFLPGYGPESDYASLFARVRDFQTFTAIGRWPVRAGDVIGFVDSTGYSEAPHLHYTIRRAGAATLLCPTNEAGFADGGWLGR